MSDKERRLGLVGDVETGDLKEQRVSADDRKRRTFLGIVLSGADGKTLEEVADLARKGEGPQSMPGISGGDLAAALRQAGEGRRLIAAVSTPSDEGELDGDEWDRVLAEIDAADSSNAPALPENYEELMGDIFSAPANYVDLLEEMRDIVDGREPENRDKAIVGWSAAACKSLLGNLRLE